MFSNNGLWVHIITGQVPWMHHELASSLQVEWADLGDLCLESWLANFL